MSRPKRERLIRFDPSVVYFKPRGVPLSQLEEIVLAADELEALRLCEVERMNQVLAAERMGVSQPTLARILGAATEKVAAAIVGGKAIRIVR